MLNIPQQHIQQGEQYFPLGELFCTCYGHREIKLKERKEERIKAYSSYQCHVPLIYWGLFLPVKTWVFNNFNGNNLLNLKYFASLQKVLFHSFRGHLICALQHSIIVKTFISQKLIFLEVFVIHLIWWENLFWQLKHRKNHGWSWLTPRFQLREKNLKCTFYWYLH